MDMNFDCSRGMTAFVRLKCLIVAAALCVSGTAIAQSRGQLVEAAKKEGKVVAYGETITPSWKKIKAGFEAKYPGITMEFVYLPTVQSLNRAMQEQDAGQHIADVMNIDAPYYDPLIKKGYIAQYVSAEAANYDAQWKSSPEGYWVRTYVSLVGVMYNRKLVPENARPDQLSKILDPRWKGKVAIVSPILNSLTLSWYAALVDDWGKEKAYGFFKSLAAQQPRMFNGGLPVSQGINTGEFPIGLGFVAHVWAVGGGPQKSSMAFAPERTMYASGGAAVAVMKNAPHPNAARLLSDYMTGREGAELNAELGYLTTYRGLNSIPEMQNINVKLPPSPIGARAADFEALKKDLRDIFGG